MFQSKSEILIQKLRNLLIVKYQISHQNLRILWEESDAFISNFMKNNIKSLNTGKFFSLITNAKLKGLSELYEDLVNIVFNLINYEQSQS